MALFRRLFRIYPGEGRGALLCSLLTFLLSVGVSGGVTLADGKFVEEVGATHLWVVYLFTSLVMLTGAMILLRVLNRISSTKIFITIVATTTAIWGLATVALLFSSSALTWYGIKIFADFLLLLVFTGVWLFLDHAYPLQRAKRLYTLFTATFVLGMAAGGAFVSLAINAIGSAGVAGALTGALAVALILGLRLQPEDQASEAEVVENISLGDLVRRILRSKYTLYLLIFNAAIFTIQSVTEYAYLDTMELVFSGSPDNEMTRFLGTTRGWIYVVDMTFGALLYSRVIRRIGIENVSFLPAGAFLLLFTSWPTLSGQLIIAVLGVIAVEGIIPCIEDTNFNLLLKAVPRKIKTKFRIFNEHFVEPIGMLIGSLLLMRFSQHAIKLGIALASVAFVMAILIRRTYSKAVYTNLQVEGEEEASAEEEVYLDFNEQDEVCMNLNRIAIDGSPHRFESILPHLNSPSLDVRRAAMGALAKLAHPAAARYARRLIAELESAEDRQVRSLCLLALQKMCRFEHARRLVMTAPSLHASERDRIEEMLISFGTPIVPILSRLTQDTSLPNSCRLLAVKALGKIAPHYVRVVEEDIEQAGLSLCHEADEAFRSYLRLIVNCVAIRAGVDDPELLYRSILSANPDIHSHAIETLEKCCPPKTYRKLLPLLEHDLQPELLKKILRPNPSVV